MGECLAWRSGSWVDHAAVLGPDALAVLLRFGDTTLTVVRSRFRSELSSIGSNLLFREGCGCLTMLDLRCRLVPLEQLGFEKLSLEGEFHKRCFTGLIYFVCDERNAWRNTRSVKYARGSFHLRLSGAMAFAESQRVQGSRWTTERWPCCVLVSDRFSLAVTEINTDIPLYRHSLNELRIAKPSLLNVAHFFAPDSPNSVIRLLTNSTGIKRWDGGFRRYRSASLGGDAKLEWTRREIAPRSKQLEAWYVMRIAVRLRSHASNHLGSLGVSANRG